MPHWFVSVRKARRCFLVIGAVLCFPPILLVFQSTNQRTRYLYCLKPPAVSPPITRIIHQSWMTQRLPPLFKFGAKSWTTCYPHWKFILWTDQLNRDLVVKRFPWFLKRYDSFPHHIERADAARYMYMFEFGGLYVDLDTECLRPFEHLLINRTLVLGAMQGQAILTEGHTQNSFMYSAPKHPFWLAMLYNIGNHSDEGRPEAVTGPNALMEVIARYRRFCADDITIYPPHHFNPFSWITKNSQNCITHGNLSLKQYVSCRTQFSSSYVIQYHAHSWEPVRWARPSRIHVIFAVTQNWLLAFLDIKFETFYIMMITKVKRFWNWLPLFESRNSYF